jgi:protein phosphatase
MSGDAFGAPWTGTAVVEEQGALFAVCDGMGGAAGGEVASAEAIEVLRAKLARPLTARHRSSVLAQRLVDALRVAARTIRDHSLREPELNGMGTTATVAALVDELLLVAQVGDSRAYLLRAGNLTQLTRDQTLARLLVERGQLTEEEALRFEASNVILQAVGTSLHVDVDLRSVALRDRDVLLLCSDGLSGPVGDESIRRILVDEENPAAACDALVQAALDAGGPDNVTCIVARVVAEGLDGAEVPSTSHVVFEPAEEVPPTDPVPASETDQSQGEQATATPRTRASPWTIFPLLVAVFVSLGACILFTSR